MKSSILLIFAIFASTVYYNQNQLATNKDQGRSVASLRAPQNINTCNYKAKDIGTIQGTGSDIHKARSAASKVCFERRIDLFEKSRNAFPSTEQGQLIIDSCVNIRCQ